MAVKKMYGSVTAQHGLENIYGNRMTDRWQKNHGENLISGVEGSINL